MSHKLKIMVIANCPSLYNSKCFTQSENIAHVRLLLILCACTLSVDIVISFSIREQARKCKCQKYCFVNLDNDVSSRVCHGMEILPLLLSVTPLSLPVKSETTDLTCALILTEGPGRSTLEFAMPLLYSVWFGAGPLS